MTNENNNFGHYTSQAGLIGIMGNQKIWATNIKYLNDENEFSDALRHIRERLIKRNKIKSDHPNYELSTEYANEIEKKVSNLDELKSESIFTTSFTKETDLLSQWRGYCQSDAGYCIKIDLQSIKEEAENQYEEVHLFDCIYSPEEKSTKIKHLLNKYWHQYRECKTKEQKKKSNRKSDKRNNTASHAFQAQLLFRRGRKATRYYPKLRCIWKYRV
ncbi:DUF2971 domain-containing protein [Marinobacter sp. V034]|uniref:DUF2971 domain-containing protein n=1 Tax=Marinobacter sp. V034 TaxID=3459610 RepID=UPI0040444FDF